MNYKQKYIKYKVKYLNFNKTSQIGGGNDDAILIYDLEKDILNPSRISDKISSTQLQINKIPTLIKQILNEKNKNVTDEKNIDIKSSNYISYTYNDKTIKLIMTTDNKGNIVSIAEYLNDQVTNKKFYFYEDTNKLEIEITDFEKEDQSKTSGTGTFILTNDEIQISGKIKLIKGVGIRTIEAIITNIKCISIECLTVNNIKNKEYMVVRDLFSLLDKEEITSSYLQQCKNILKSISSSIPYKPIYNDIINTICSKLYYYYPENEKKILIKYKNLVKLIVTNDFEQIQSNISTDTTELQNLMKEIPKSIPSTFINKYFLIKNNLGKYIQVDTDHKIIFDSGNDSVTLIGQNIVDKLNLIPIKGCVINASGIGGKVKQCGKYVELEFKFDDSYPMTNKKVYKIIAFIDNINLKDTLLFGHSNGLDLLFNDNYLIKNKYDEADSRNKDDIKFYKQINDEYDRLERYINGIESQINNDQINPSMELELLLSPINRFLIHTYHTSIPETKIKNIFSKLREVKQKLETNKIPSFNTYLNWINSIISNEDIKK